MPAAAAKTQAHSESKPMPISPPCEKLPGAPPIVNKVVYINAYFKAVGKTVTVKVPTGETTKGFFGGEKPVYEKRELLVV